MVIERKWVKGPRHCWDSRKQVGYPSHEWVPLEMVTEADEPTERCRNCHAGRRRGGWED